MLDFNHSDRSSTTVIDNTYVNDHVSSTTASVVVVLLTSLRTIIQLRYRHVEIRGEQMTIQVRGSFTGKGTTSQLKLCRGTAAGGDQLDNLCGVAAYLADQLGNLCG